MSTMLNYGLLNRLETSESSITSILLEAALKISSLHGVDAFVMIDLPVGRVWAGQKQLREDFLHGGLHPRLDDIEYDIDPNIISVTKRLTETSPLPPKVRKTSSRRRLTEPELSETLTGPSDVVLESSVPRRNVADVGGSNGCGGGGGNGSSSNNSLVNEVLIENPANENREASYSGIENMDYNVCGDVNPKGKTPGLVVKTNGGGTVGALRNTASGLVGGRAIGRETSFNGNLGLVGGVGRGRGGANRNVAGRSIGVSGFKVGSVGRFAGQANSVANSVSKFGVGAAGIKTTLPKPNLPTVKANLNGLVKSDSPRAVTFNPSTPSSPNLPPGVVMIPASSSALTASSAATAPQNAADAAEQKMPPQEKPGEPMDVPSLAEALRDAEETMEQLKEPLVDSYLLELGGENRGGGTERSSPIEVTLGSEGIIEGIDPETNKAIQGILDCQPSPVSNVDLDEAKIFEEVKTPTTTTHETSSMETNGFEVRKTEGRIISPHPAVSLTLPSLTSRKGTSSSTLDAVGAKQPVENPFEMFLKSPQAQLDLSQILSEFKSTVSQVPASAPLSIQQVLSTLKSTFAQGLFPPTPVGQPTPTANVPTVIIEPPSSFCDAEIVSKGSLTPSIASTFSPAPLTPKASIVAKPVLTAPLSYPGPANFTMSPIKGAQISPNKGSVGQSSLPTMTPIPFLTAINSAAAAVVKGGFGGGLTATTAVGSNGAVNVAAIQSTDTTSNIVATSRLGSMVPSNAAGVTTSSPGGFSPVISIATSTIVSGSNVSNILSDGGGGGVGGGGADCNFSESEPNVSVANSMANLNSGERILTNSGGDIAANSGASKVEIEILGENSSEYKTADMSPSMIGNTIAASINCLNQADVRKRSGTFSSQQTEVLSTCYNITKYPTCEKKKELAQSLGLTDNQVKNWFHTRRKKDKKHLGQ